MPEKPAAAASAPPPPPLRRLTSARYVTPLREGGSVPALVEADDGKLWVVKLRGAAQGGRALVAELVGGQIARALGLAAPELALVELDAALARSEPNAEIQDLLRASAGTNLGLLHLNGAVTFDPAAAAPAAARAASLTPSEDVASRIVLLDSFINNVDRTARNPNLMWWSGQLAPIDHGAALYWQHDWDGTVGGARPDRPFPLVKSHVLLPWAGALPAAGAALAAALGDDAFADAVAAQIPDTWLTPLAAAADAGAQRAAYAGWLRARRAAIPALVEEAARARTPSV